MGGHDGVRGSSRFRGACRAGAGHRFPLEQVRRDRLEAQEREGEVDRLWGTGGRGFDPSLRVWWLCFEDIVGQCARRLQVNRVLSGLYQLRLKACMVGTLPPGSRCPGRKSLTGRGASSGVLLTKPPP